MKKTAAITISIIALSLSACSPKASPETTVKLSTDFFVSVAPVDFTPRFAVATDRAECENQISAALCETNLDMDSITSNWQRVKCGPESAQHLSLMMQIYDEMPELMRPSLCSVERIFISDEIYSTAFATAIQTPFGEMIGGYIGFRKQSFLKQPSSKDLTTWKEQLAFGGSKVFLSNDPNLVQTSYNLKTSHLQSDGLFYVLMHELGHLIDFRNGVNPAGEWPRLSWSGSQPTAKAKYTLQEKFCFYDCREMLKASQAQEIYSSLPHSGFITTYSGANSYEDFAEFWAWHLALKHKNADFRVTVPGHPEVSITEEWSTNPLITEKFRFIQELADSADLQVDNRARR